MYKQHSVEMQNFIQNYSKGVFTIHGKEIDHSLILFNTSVSKTSTTNNIQLGHLGKLLEKKPSYLVIGNGPFGRAKVSGELQDYISSKNIRLIIKPTPQACQEYNRILADGKIVAGFLINKFQF